MIRSSLRTNWQGREMVVPSLRAQQLCSVLMCMGSVFVFDFDIDGIY